MSLLYLLYLKTNSTCVSFLFCLLWKWCDFSLHKAKLLIWRWSILNQAMQKWIISLCTFWHCKHSDVLGFNLILCPVFGTEQVIILTKKKQFLFFIAADFALPALALCSFIRVFITQYCLESWAKSCGFLQQFHNYEMDPAEKHQKEMFSRPCISSLWESWFGISL